MMKKNSPTIYLNTNENPLGASPQVQQILTQQPALAATYPDDNAPALTQALADKFNVSAEQIVIGAGSSDILEKIVRRCAQQQQAMLIAEYAFKLYKELASTFSVDLTIVTEKNYTTDLSAFTAAITKETGLIIIANPNSPTGTWLTAVELRAFIQAVPNTITIVIDEAYAELMQDTNYASMLPLLNDHPNLIIVRTFSKVYGLAGLRLGYALCHAEMAFALKALKKPYEVSSLALAAGVAALQDDVHLQASIDNNQQGIERLKTFFAEKNLDVLGFGTNFVTVDFGGQATAIHQQLLSHNIVTCYLGSFYDLPNHLRISIGTPKQTEKLLAVLREILN